MTILIENLQTSIEVDSKVMEIIRTAAESTLKMECFTLPSEVSVLLADNEGIQEINRDHRNIDKPTDVLSFPMAEVCEGELLTAEGDIDLDEELLLLGDIVISLEKAREQAENYGHSFEREVAFLMVHGMLHLLGYDHEQEEKEKQMIEKQETVLGEMGLKREL